MDEDDNVDDADYAKANNEHGRKLHTAQQQPACVVARGSRHGRSAEAKPVYCILQVKDLLAFILQSAKSRAALKV